jgi:multidrug resistance protein, MATE family
VSDTSTAFGEGVEAAGAHGALPASDQPMQRRVLGLAWPVIGENMLETLLGVVDTLLVGALGAVALAGVGSSLQVLFFLISVLSALAIGSSVLVAQAIGAQDRDRAGMLGRQSLLWSVIFSIPLSILGFLLSAPIIGLFGLEPQVAQIGVEYLQVTMGTVIVLIGLFIGGGVLRGAGDSRTPMVVTAIANVINVGLAYALIYGVAGFPALGAVGSAWATFVARGLALGLLVSVLWRGRNGVRISGPGSWRPQFGIAKQVLTLGIPAAIEQVLTSLAFFVLTILVAHLGTEMVAAHRLVITAVSFAFLPGIGFAIAATALVGQSVGARRIEDGAEAARIATIWSVIWMGAVSAVLFVFARPILGWFSSDPLVIASGVPGLRIIALAQPAWAVMFTQAGALRGMGNTRFPLVAGTLGIWSGVLLGYTILQVFGGNLAAIWLGFVLATPVTAFLLWRQFRTSVARMAAEQGAA